MKDMSNFVTEFEKAEENYFEGLTALLKDYSEDGFRNYNEYIYELEYGTMTYRISLVRTRDMVYVSGKELESGMGIRALLDEDEFPISSRTFSDIHHWLVDRFVETYKNKEEP